jgi:dipeptidase D
MRVRRYKQIVFLKVLLLRQNQGMSRLRSLKPESIWKYFEEISKIPRLSKNEGKIRRYLLDFAKINKLEAYEDEVGNILIIKPASTGFENKKTIVLQSHLDMVGEKNSDHQHNWNEDPILPVIKDGWVTAQGTTLGADDGIGIAAQLAILNDKSIKTGRIECLFTVDEESGMTGANNLTPDFFEGRTLINLDSEDEGILYIGCAGGIDTVGTLFYKTEPTTDKSIAFDISLTGLRGGHSGDEIHKGFGNSVKIMTRILSALTGKYNIRINKFNGGNLRNAIPREAFSTITVEKVSYKKTEKYLQILFKTLSQEFKSIEPDLKFEIKEVALPDSILDKESHAKLLYVLDSIPHGVIRWAKEMEDLVETSTNLASVKFENGNKILIVSTQRSSVETSKREIASEVESYLKNVGASVTHSEGYPGWEPNLSSEILKITRNSYKKLFGKDPSVKAIHAGLECGLIYEKFIGIDMISIGPTIRGAHTPEEKINIETTQMFWDLLIDVISPVQIN